MGSDFGRLIMGVGYLLMLGGGCACNPGVPNQTPPESSLPSPNATITPAPLISGTRLMPKTAKTQSGKSATTKRTTASSPPEAPVPLMAHQPPSRDLSSAKQSAPVMLQAELLWPAFNASLQPFNATQKRREEFRSKTARKLEIQLRPHGRLQLEFQGRAFPFADQTRVSARYENFGHFLAWPGLEQYRILPVGTLRTLLGEGRPDVTPVMNIEGEPRPGLAHLGLKTTLWQFETSRGRLQLSQAEVPAAEFAAPLLCRFLLEWLSIAPTASACEGRMLPLRAEYELTTGGKLVFAVTHMSTRAETPIPPLFVPPRGASYRQFGLPNPTPLLSDVDLSALRRSQDTGELSVHNRDRFAAYLLLDGTPAAFLPAGDSITLSGISTGQYNARLVDFFGTEILSQPGLAVGKATSFGAPRETSDGGLPQ